MARSLSLIKLVLSIIVFLSLIESVFPAGYYDDVPDRDAVGFVMVFTTAFVFMSFSLVGIIFVFVRIYIKWRDTQKTLSIALRVPLYLGVLNAILWVGELVNFMHPVIYHTNWPDQTCKVMAGISIAFTLLERFMTASIAVVTYLRVCRRIYWNYGKYDWKLWFVSGAIALLFTIMGSSKFGPTYYWCGAARGEIYVVIVGLGVSVVVLLVVVFCYFKTIMAIRDVVKQASTVNATPKNGNSSDSHLNGIKGSRDRRQSAMAHSTSDDIQAKVTKKVMGYILVFILQWFPIFPYDIYEILDKDAAWVYALVAISFNFGGIGNAICYVMNEGWGIHGNNSSMIEGNEDHTSNTSASSNVERFNSHENDDDLINPIPLQERSVVLEVKNDNLAIV
ncbi:15919_t:CDS:2 [Acaulospora morrowiae]|uniref:15919_t:CDS:1 n=1 Tax=Acaulospora morrowiae TaxID=94023 RepID=A0A9N8V348_9GLOM|nr:15919_t:CDS:2 [Acaulospora morrowiae]